jgi:ElaB/YqjD/DUF883 family membrane-anchored ribosome-binding protein
MRGNGNGNGNRRPEEIQAEIARTRGEMDRTLSAIENRLTPGQLVDQGIDYLKHSGAREYLTNLGGSVKYNPMPVALTAIGIAWLVAMQNRPVQYRFVETRGSYGEGGFTGEQTEPGMMSSAREKMGEGVDAAKDKMYQASERMSEMKDRVGERVSDLSQQARLQAERMKGGWDSMLREHPLAIGAIGLALGAVAAALAPRTRREDELMGSTRDRLMDQAASVAGEKMQSVKDEVKGDSSNNPPSFSSASGRNLDNGPRNPS